MFEVENDFNENRRKIMDDLQGKKFGFYGVDNNCFKLGRKVYEAIENEDDGYRSFLESVEVVADEGIFFDRPLGYVEVKCSGPRNYFDGYLLVDVKDGHVWLRVGTDKCDDYYPYFVFDYQPKMK